MFSLESALAGCDGWGVRCFGRVRRWVQVGFVCFTVAAVIGRDDSSRFWLGRGNKFDEGEANSRRWWSIADSRRIDCDDATGPDVERGKIMADVRGQPWALVVSLID